MPLRCEYCNNFLGAPICNHCGAPAPKPKPISVEYCHFCGEKLTPHHFGKYDEYSGKPLMKSVCSSSKCFKSPFYSRPVPQWGFWDYVLCPPILLPLIFGLLFLVFVVAAYLQGFKP